jgi:hypothetical protein
LAAGAGGGTSRRSVNDGPSGVATMARMGRGS